MYVMHKHTVYSHTKLLAVCHLVLLQMEMYSNAAKACKVSMRSKVQYAASSNLCFLIPRPKARYN